MVYGSVPVGLEKGLAIPEGEDKLAEQGYSRLEISQFESIKHDKELNVTMARYSPEESQERLAIMEENPAEYFAVSHVSEILNKLGIFWCYFGSFSYQIETQSGAVKPDDRDIIFDAVAAEDILLELIRSEHIYLPIPRVLEHPETKSNVLQFFVKTPSGESIPFEMFGQNMRVEDKKDENGIINVGSGTESWVVKQYLDKNGAVHNHIDRFGNGRIYLDRFVHEYQADLADMIEDPHLKIKSAGRIHKAQALLPEGADFQKVYNQVAGDLNEDELNSLNTVLGQSYQRFLEEVEIGDSVEDDRERYTQIVALLTGWAKDFDRISDQREYTVDRLTDWVKYDAAEIRRMYTETHTKAKQLITNLGLGDVKLSDPSFGQRAEDSVRNIPAEDQAEVLEDLQDVLYQLGEEIEYVRKRRKTYAMVFEKLTHQDYPLFVALDHAHERFLKRVEPVLRYDEIVLITLEKIMNTIQDGDEPQVIPLEEAQEAEKELGSIDPEKLKEAEERRREREKPKEGER